MCATKVNRVNLEFHSDFQYLDNAVEINMLALHSQSNIINSYEVYSIAYML